MGQCIDQQHEERSQHTDHDRLCAFWLTGLKMAEASTGKTRPLQPDGALMLGGEQVVIL